MLPRLLAVLVLLGLSGCAATSSPRMPGEALRGSEPSPGPRTRAEASGFTATSTHAEVMAFLEALPPDPRRHVASFGTTPEGRALPLVVWGAPAATPEAIRATGKTRVLVFANIHAGEVDGKEAMLVLLRDLAAGHHDAWADSLVLMISPIYNADGNDRIALGNRPLQYGPTSGMGQRPTASGLDLNRDFTKLAAPESRALVALIRDADPHVVLDLHTTNGTAMAYGLTYAPGLHPDTPAGITADLFDRWLPAVSQRLEATGGPLTYHYGNVPGAFGEEASAPRGWYSYSAQPRYSANYVGLRGRYGILSESYSYDSFETRIRSSRHFVEEVVEQVWREASHVRAAVEAADRDFVVGRQVAVRSIFAALPEPARILLGRVDTLANPNDGTPMRRNTGAVIPETMPAYVRFEASESVRAPRAYTVNGTAPGVEAVASLLDAHGITYRCDFIWGVAREAFRVDSISVARRPNQGVRTVETFGRWEAVPAETGNPPRLAASLVVPVDQPLGRLVVALFEPRSDDGVVAWGILPAEAFAPGDLAPIQRLP